MLVVYANISSAEESADISIDRRREREGRQKAILLNDANERWFFFIDFFFCIVFSKKTK